MFREFQKAVWDSAQQSECPNASLDTEIWGFFGAVFTTNYGRFWISYSSNSKELFEIVHDETRVRECVKVAKYIIHDNPAGGSLSLIAGWKIIGRGSILFQNN